MNRRNKKGGFAYTKQLTNPISGCDDKKVYNLMGGNQGRIATYAQYSPDWYDIGERRPFAVDATVGINEYQFGRTTPDNKFVVASGLVGNDTGLLMTGGKKTVKNRKTTPKKVTTPLKKKSIVSKKPAKNSDENFLKSFRKLFGMNSNKNSVPKKTTTKKSTVKKTAKKSTVKKTAKKSTVKKTFIRIFF